MHENFSYEIRRRNGDMKKNIVKLWLPNLEYLLELLVVVWWCGNDDGSVQQVQGDTVGGGVGGSADFCNTPARRTYDFITLYYAESIQGSSFSRVISPLNAPGKKIQI